jgi:hypothetical protein
MYKSTWLVMNMYVDVCAEESGMTGLSDTDHDKESSLGFTVPLLAKSPANWVGGTFVIHHGARVTELAVIPG